jgi:hypothetical protein
MDGVQMLLNRIPGMLGIPQDQVDKLRDAIPKLQTEIPAFAIAIKNKVAEIEASQAESKAAIDRIEAMVTAIFESHGEHITSQAVPAAPEPPAGKPS